MFWFRPRSRARQGIARQRQEEPPRRLSHYQESGHFYLGPERCERGHTLPLSGAERPAHATAGKAQTRIADHLSRLGHERRQTKQARQDASPERYGLGTRAQDILVGRAVGEGMIG